MTARTFTPRERAAAARGLRTGLLLSLLLYAAIFGALARCCGGAPVIAAGQVRGIGDG